MIPFLLASAFEISPVELDSALADAGRNRPELEKAISGAGDLADQASWLVANMPHLDRLEITGECLLNHIRFANRFREGLPDSIFRDYLLSYRIWDEPCEDWREALSQAFMDCKTPRDILRKVSRTVSLDTTRFFFGPFPPPLTTLRSGRGSKTECCVLLVAALRARGFPARLVRCPSPASVWVEHYDQGAWKPLYFEKPENPSVILVQKGFGWAQATPRYARTGTLRIAFTLFGQPDTSFEGFSIQKWESYRWEPLDDLWWPPENGSRPKIGDSWIFQLAPGNYLLTWGRRNARGEPFVRVREVKIKAGRELSLILETSVPPENINPGDIMARPLDSIPRIKLSDGRALNDTLEFPAILAFLGEDEGSYRTEKQLEGLRGLNVYLIKIGVGEGLCISPDSLKKALGSDRLPSVILLDETGRPVLWIEGFSEGLPVYIKALIE